MLIGILINCSPPHDGSKTSFQLHAGLNSSFECLDSCLHSAEYKGGKGRLRWFEYHSYNGLKGSEQLACCRLKCCTFHLRGKRFSLETCSVLRCLIKVDRGRVKIIASLIACIGAKVPHVLYPHLLGSRFCVALRVSGSKGFCKNAQCTFVKLKHIFGAERMCGAVLGSFCIGCLLRHFSLEPAKGIANISAKQLGCA